MTTELLIQKYKLIHEDKYDYSKVSFVDKYSKVNIICYKHGEFSILPYAHYKYTCPKCSIENRRNSNKDIISRFIAIHGDKFDYSIMKYTGMNTPIDIICKKHNLIFKQTPNSHCKGSECPKCRYEKSGKSKKNNIEDIIDRFKQIYGDIYDYSKFIYEHIQKPSTIICKKHGEYLKNTLSHLNGSACSRCNNYSTSKPEIEIYDFIKKYFNSLIQSDRNILKGKEIDIYIPELKIGIEYNGLYWHSDLYKDKSYHLDKLKLSNSSNIKLIQIFSDEWLYKQDIVKSRLLNIIGKIPNKIYARKCEIREVESKDCSNFLDQNHIQGKLGAKVRLGLYHNGELVSLMTFGNLRKNLGQTSKEGNYELLRFCNKLNTTVIGGASKLFKYFINNYNPVKVISYADRRWSQGELYYTLGFKLVSKTRPNYFYVNKYFLNRESRFKYRKDMLIKNGFDPNKSEYEIMKDNGYTRIYDCGVLKFEYISN